MIEDSLKQLGFAEKEIQIYLAILKQGKTTPAKLSKLTGINRSTVYSIAKGLLENGIILEDLGASTSHLVALPPSDLKNLAARDERNLQEKKVLIDQAIEQLKSFTKDSKYSIPKITFIYEEDLENFLYKQAPEWNSSIMKNDGIWWGFQDPTFVKLYQKWIDWFWKKCADEKLVLKILTNETEFERKIAQEGYNRRLVKFWEKGANFTATTWVTGDYLILVMTSQKPYYLVQIHDTTLAHNMREIFKSI